MDAQADKHDLPQETGGFFGAMHINTKNLCREKRNESSLDWFLFLYIYGVT